MTLRHLAALAFAFALQLAGCGGGGGIGGTGIVEGTMRVSITDAPACGYDHVYITVEKVRVHQSAGAADGDAGWSEVVLAPAQRIDLLGLTNGITQELGQTALPAGRYTQMRLVLAANGSGTPPANSVVLSGSGEERALDTPSAQQSGIKLNADIDVPAGKEADVLLDFDACRSVVKAGNSGKYLLKPVIAVTTVLSDAGLRVSGNVDPAIAAADTSISVQSNGAEPIVVKATVPRADGSFLLRPVPAGTYNLVVTSAGHVTAVMTGVPVVAAAPTVVSSATAPIAPAAAASAAAAVTGTVTPVSATLRALQTLSGGPTVEVAFAPVDTLGNFAFLLPVSAPQRTAYVPNPGVITLTSDAAPAVAGRYTLEATSAGGFATLAINVNSQPVPAVHFTLP